MGEGMSRTQLQANRVMDTIRELLKYVTYNAKAKVGFAITMIFVLTAVVEGIGGYKILPYDPLKYFVGKPFSPPSLQHPFGTTELGRDLFSMIIAGTPAAAIVTFAVVGFAFIFGGLLGSISAYFGGTVDEVLMRITDMFLTIPGLIFAMVLAFILGPSIYHAMIALMIFWWPTYARLARSEALRIVQMNFVEAAKLAGIPSWKIIFRHVYSVVTPTLLTYATMDLGTVVLAYSALSFLGLSVRLPYPDWGYMISAYLKYIFTAPWLPLTPVFVILFVAAGFILLGDGLRDAIGREYGLR